jgi:hypothetical protein
MKRYLLLLAALAVGAFAAPPSVTPQTSSVSVDSTGAVVFPSARQLVQSFTASGRSSAVPVAVGQLGIETDTGIVYYGTGTSAGNWSTTASVFFANNNSGFQVLSNGSGGYKLCLWNADQSKYQEIRIAGSSGQERLIIGP